MEIDLHSSAKNKIQYEATGKLVTVFSCGPVGWDHRRHLKWIFWIWHSTLWWWGSSNAGALGFRVRLYFHCSQVHCPEMAVLDGVISMGQIELYTDEWLTLNWIVKNRTVWIYVKTGFGIAWSIVDMSWNQTRIKLESDTSGWLVFNYISKLVSF